MKKIFVLMLLACTLAACSSDKDELVKRDGQYINLETGDKGPAIVYFSNLETGSVTRYEYTYGDLKDFIKVDRDDVARTNNSSSFYERYEKMFGYAYDPDYYMGVINVTGGVSEYILVYNY